MQVLDFSAGVPSAAAVKAAGYGGAVRYISPGREAWMRGKNATREQVDAYTAAGLGVAFVWQYRASGQDTLRGGAGGREDAQNAKGKLDYLGRPDAPVYFAVDFDCTLDQWNTIVVHYFRAANQILGVQRTGVYGSSRVCAWAVEDGVVGSAGGGKHFCWQTTAWSRGEIGSEAVLLQKIGTVTVDGIACDINDVLHTNWGTTSQAQPPAPQQGGTVDLSHADVDMTSLITFGGPRSTANLQAVCLHTVEGNPNGRIEDVAYYQARSQSGSYHDIIGTDGRVLAENTDDWKTWSAGDPANNTMIHISFNGLARWSRDEWLAQEKMLRAGARRTAWRCQKWGIPPKAISPTEVRAGARGICDHNATRLAWGSTTHTDVGQGFPWDVFIRYVNEALTGSTQNQPAVKEDTMTNFDLLQARYNSRVEGSNVTMTPLDALLNADANAWVARKNSEEALAIVKRIEAKLEGK